LLEVSIAFRDFWSGDLTLATLAGGTAACVIAGRLAEADPKLSILVIEQGPNNLDVPTVVHPALFMGGLLPTSNATLFYQGNAEKQLNNRELVVPSGGTLGGGSSINLMMYSRAQRRDFDAWDVPGWSAKSMIPYLQKVCASKNCIGRHQSTLLSLCSLRPTSDQAQSLYMVMKDP
jgi:choline dehydrogenase-like flavoprotein